ncbi:MAG: DUF4124 domain-containing protein [Gammaproteobacteria bacterium]|nr:DUF4124 domain-containing protein [Gammaproteobacteria bacterium]
MAHAGKIYKWTDESGVVHFGQQPPSAEIKEITLKNTQSGVMKPHERSSGLYCGELRIRYKHYKKRSSSSHDLESRITAWGKLQKRSKKNLDRYLEQMSKIDPYRKKSRNSRHQSADFYERKNSLIQPIRQYNCAIAWAKSEIKTLRTHSSEIRNRYNEAQGDLAAAQNQQREICGDEPSDYNTYGNTRDKYQKWEQCRRKYGAVVKRMQRRLQKSEIEFDNIR